MSGSIYFYRQAAVVLRIFTLFPDLFVAEDIENPQNADDKIISPDQESSRRILRDQIEEILSSLSDKEREIVEMRNGLGEYEGYQHTLEEVGSKFGVTRERIRQIEAKVHEKIRNHPKADRWRNF